MQQREYHNFLHGSATFYSGSSFSLHLHRVVKLSSPYLNVLIIVGVIMFYVDVILFGVDERTASRCTVNAFCMVRTEGV